MIKLSIQYLRSVLFLLGFALSTFIMVIPCLLVSVFPYSWRTRFVNRWNAFNLWWLGISCGLTFRVQGEANIPTHASIVMSNHQSTWETLALSRFFPPLTWVIKRELLWIPVFGWGLAVTSPIPLDRKAGKKALIALVKAGTQRLQQGRWIVIFPEGTRTPPGIQRPLKIGGFILASKAQATIVPVAHNSGKFWARKQLLKKAGVIDVVIGPPIEGAGKSAEELKIQYENWLSETRHELDR